MIVMKKTKLLMFFEFFKFSIVGVSALFIYLFLTYLLHIWGLGLVVASNLGYIISVAISFFGQKYLTFQVKTVSNFKIGIFLILSTFGFIFSNFAFLILEAYDINKYSGVFITVICVPIFNFFVMKFIVFNNKND